MMCSRLVRSSCLLKAAGARSSALIPSTQHLPVTSFSTTLSKRSSGDHVKMWTAERLVSIAQIPICIVPFMWTNPINDAIFCTLAVLHSHWGIEAIVVDYIRPSLFNGSTVIPNIAVSLVWALSAFTLGALYYFNYTDVGIINAIKMLWRL
eukprot:TRINITY_DN21304_c0_g1_i1.p1 TRINITY_DN21304_c0_g1~~TRINITY_DN21304_c0_g1_i1.p1  ORF type:complete len:160 (-),score=34.48 TRINITY_DN21304_c0_g1_i1:813-1265(-)